MNAIDTRRNQLVAERTALEAARRSIAEQLPIPNFAMSYLTSRLGGDGSTYKGDEIRPWLDARLKQIDEELRRLPVRLIIKRSYFWNCMGKFFGTYRGEPD